MLPWLVRGRWLVADVVAASAWAAGTAAASAAVAQLMNAPDRAAWCSAAIAAGILALRSHSFGEAVVEP